jgi:hypothetical protein
MSAFLAVAATGPFDCGTPAPVYGGPPVPPPTVSAAPLATDAGIADAPEDTTVRYAAPAYGMAPRPKPTATPTQSVPGPSPQSTVDIGPIKTK